MKFKFGKKSKSVIVKIGGSSPALFLTAFQNGNPVMQMQCVREDASALLICDIMPCPEGANNRYNKGYGSKLMEELFAYASANDIKSISGNLSKWDLDHKDRLHHFYKKHGFTITEYAETEIKDNYYGKITKIVGESNIERG